MASSTGHPGPVSRETYWKRRAFVLAGLMLVLTLVALAFRNTPDDGEPVGSQAGVEEPEASPSVPADEPSDPENGEDDEEPSASPSPSPSEEDGNEDAEDTEDGSGEGTAEASAPERPEDPCRPQDVFVTFDFAEKDREVYGGGAGPEFRVTVVNVAEQTCTMDVGPEAFELRIDSGDDRVFSSADCVEGNSKEERQLTQGSPHEYTLTWELERSFTDCRENGAKAQPGWYKANLRGDHGGSVDQLVFQLKA